MARFEFRRSVYLRYLNAGEAVDHQSIGLRSAMEAGDREVVKESRQEFFQNLLTLTAAKEEVILVSNDAIGDLVTEDTSRVISDARNRLYGEPERAASCRARLLFEMKRDLAGNAGRWPWRKVKEPKWLKAEEDQTSELIDTGDVVNPPRDTDRASDEASDLSATSPPAGHVGDDDGRHQKVGAPPGGLGGG